MGEWGKRGGGMRVGERWGNYKKLGKEWGTGDFT